MSVPAQEAARPPVLDRVLRDFEALAAQLPEQIVPRAARRRAAAQLAKLGWPHGRDEQWRYANLRPFDRLSGFSPPALAPVAAAVAELPPPLEGFERLVFIDGVRAGGHPEGARGVATPARANAAGEPVWSAEQRLALLGDMFAQDAAVLRVATAAQIELLFVTTRRAEGGAVYPRLQVELAPGARLTLIERHFGNPAALALCCASALVELGRGAQLTHYRLQQCGAQLLFADTLTARLQEQALYQVRQLAVGAAAARSSGCVRLVGRDAGFDWQSIAVAHTAQAHDTTLRVEHGAPGTRTNEVFRGIAEDRSRVAFSGHIHIEPGASGAQACQSLRGLIEGAGAEIDLRPRLQIDTDEVSAQHGATTGRLDEQLLFYLLARGLDPKTARALLKWAFLGDVLRAFELPSLRAQAERSAAGPLQDVVALGALPEPRLGALS